MESKCGIINNITPLIVFIMYFVGLLFIPIRTDITNKIIIITGFISLIYIIINRVVKFDKGTIVLFFGLFLLGAIDLIWYTHYKTDHVVYKNAYRGYLESGKMLVLSAFTFLLLAKNKHTISLKFHVIAASLTQICIFLLAYYQSIYLNAERIPLSAMYGHINQMGAATIAAYMITFCTLYSSIVFIQLESKYKWLFFYINFAISFSTIVMTGTRAAIFTFPLMMALILFIQYRGKPALLAKNFGGICILLIFCGLLFNKELGIRVDQLTHDVTSYTQSNNSVSSVGARFSMIFAGYKSMPDGLSWQSLEQRADKIIFLSKENKIYAGATHFLDVHMHNEIIESLSTKGVFGVILILFFYVALISYSIMKKQYFLLVFPASIMLFGISDVITHDKPIPASWIVCLFLSVLLLNNKKEQV